MEQSHLQDRAGCKIDHIIFISGRRVSCNFDSKTTLHLQMPFPGWVIEEVNGKEVGRHNMENIESIYWD